MKQAFDPFAEPLSEAPPADEPAPRTSGSSSDWSPPEEGVVETIMRIVRRRKWIVLQALVIVPLAAAAYSLHQPTQYTASASLLFRDPVNAVGANSGTLVDPTREAATNSALVSLPVVATYASRATGGRISAAEIRSSASIGASDGGSDVVSISAISGSPVQAAAIANAYGEGYIAFRREADRSALSTSITQIQANIAALPADEQRGAEGTQLRTQLEALQTSQALRTGDAELVQPASPPSAPSGPHTRRNVILGVIVGLILGLALAALVDRLDRRVRTEDDFERIYGLPVIARIPRLRSLRRGEVALDSAEPFRTLRTNLRYLNYDRRLRSIMIASPLPEDGKSTVARSLAVTMAAMGDHVVLVDIDLHKQRSTDDRVVGLSRVLIGADLDDGLVSETVQLGDGGEPRLLTLLPAGPTPPNPSELIDSERMREVLQELERRFDLVILDAPALASVSDGLTLVPAVSGMLIVAGLGHTTQKAAVDLRRQISLLHGHPVGIVANFTRMPRHRYGYGYGR